MQKIVSILEQHVQWLAIALGALFTLFMIYTYVLQSPTQVPVGSENVGPGEMPRSTNEKTTQELKTKIESPQKIVLQVPKPAEQFKTRMAWSGAEPTPLASIWYPIPAEVKVETTPPTPGPGGEVAASQPAPAGGLVV